MRTIHAIPVRPTGASLVALLRSDGIQTHPERKEVCRGVILQCGHCPGEGSRASACQAGVGGKIGGRAGVGDGREIDQEIDEAGNEEIDCGWIIGSRCRQVRGSGQEVESHDAIRPGVCRWYQGRRREEASIAAERDATAPQ